MKRFLTLLIAITALLGLYGSASATHRNSHRHHRARHAKVEPPLPALLLPDLHPKVAETFNDAGKPVARLGRAETVDYVNKHDQGNLNEFGIAKFGPADLRRFGQDKYVVEETAAHKFGVKFKPCSGFGPSDRAREAKFKAEYGNLWVKAYNDEVEYRRTHPN